MEDHREKDKRVEEDAMRRFFSSQPTGFICPILNGPCSTMTEAEEIEAELHTRIKELEAQLAAAEARVKELEEWSHADRRLINELYATITRLREGIYDIKNITDDYDAPIGRLMAANSLARSLLEVKDVTNTAGGEGKK